MGNVYIYIVGVVQVVIYIYGYILQPTDVAMLTKEVFCKLVNHLLREDSVHALVRPGAGP